jgi:hypothetical protein
MKKIIYIITIFASVSVYADVYEKNVDGVETISNIYTPGAKQMDVKPTKVVSSNSINEHQDGTIYWNGNTGQIINKNGSKQINVNSNNLNGDQDKTIYWTDDSGQPIKHNNDKKLHDVKKDLNEFINSYKESESS